MKLKLTMEVEVKPRKNYTDLDVIKGFVGNGIAGLTHEAFDDDDNILGEVDVNGVEIEVEADDD